MKSAWLALSVLAVANVLGLVAFFGWLKATDRLDRSRLEQVRAIFATTVSQEKAQVQQKESQAEAEARAAAERARLSKPGVTAEQELESRFDATEIDRQRRQRIHDEIASLQRILGERMSELERLNAQIADARSEFEALTKRSRAQATDQQFKKTLSVLEGLKAPLAKTMLRQTMDASIDGMEQSIAYLNAMEDETRTAVMQEFIKEDPKLAAELLQRLRTRGVPPPVPGVPTG